MGMNNKLIHQEAESWEMWLQALLNLTNSVRKNNQWQCSSD